MDDRCLNENSEKEEMSNEMSKNTDISSESQKREDGGYSMVGSDIPQSRTELHPAEYEVSYDSRSHTTSYSNNFSTEPSEPKKKKKMRGGLWITSLALTLILSCAVGGVCGYLAGSSVGGSTESTPNPDQLSAEEIVKKYTATLENSTANQESSLTKATKVAYDSVVIIDTYAGEEAERIGQPSGSGSGVIWSTGGYVVTCNHVVEGAAIIKVTLTDGKSYVASVVGTDSRTDLAVLKITASDSILYPAVIRNTDAAPLVLAETVIAIGNPLGVLGGTVTDGILSCLERSITIEGQAMTLLQTSASVNSGNSGGGLFDINGSLIGIVNAKSTGTDVEGLGFAIPITTVAQIAEELITNGYVTGRPQLGVQVVSVNYANAGYIFGADYYPQLKDYVTRKSVWGRTEVVYGVYLYDGSAVQYAEGSEKMEFGDRITYVAGKEISETDDITEALGNYSAGEEISVTVVRDHSQAITVKIILGQAGASK